MAHDWSPQEAVRLKSAIRQWGRELGFAAVAFAPADDLTAAAAGLAAWLAQGYQGDMDYMARHGSKRSRPGELVPGTRSIICARLDYLSETAARQLAGQAPVEARVSLYAQGRDYHKVLRNRLAQLARRIEATVGAFGWRAFTDSAPVMEVELAHQSGLGWRGKHTLLLSRQGSWFFLGELFTDLPLPPDPPETGHCGRCVACLGACPTGAFVAPYVLDARRCVSYLTIEHPGPIPEDLRPLLGNRIYGCDDCQVACPWNRFAKPTALADFGPRAGLDSSSLAGLFAWSEAEFDSRLAGSAIRRIGHQRWLRNIAVALGNGPATPEARAALAARLGHPSPLVREHVGWALARMDSRLPACDNSDPCAPPA